LATPLALTAAGTKAGSPSDDSGRLTRSSGASSLAHSRTVARIGLQVAEALAYAHTSGFLHRAIKPSNILLDAAGTAWVTDFGLAKAAEEGEDLTQTGDIIGTIRYLPPERFDGRSDARGDVYSVGATHYELLTLRPLFEETERPRLIERVLGSEPILPRQTDRHIPRDLETIILKTIEKDPARRYATADQMAEDLRRFLEDEPVLARPPSALYHLRKFARRHKALVGGAAATVVALALGLVGTILFAVGEARQCGVAEQNAQQAMTHEREALFQTYRARLAAAVSALAAHDVEDAERQLDAAPKELRGWEWRHVCSRLDDSASVIDLPTGGSGFLVPGRDRLRIGIVSPDGMRLTDLDGGVDSTLPLRAKNPREVTAAETRLGLRIAVRSGPGVCDLFDDAGRCVGRVENPDVEQFGPVAMSPDGTRLASPWRQGNWVRLAVFDATSGKRTVACEGHVGEIWSFAFSPDGTRLASGGQDETARLLDSDIGTLLVTFRGHASRVVSVAFSPDGTRLLTTSADGTACQWDVATGREVEPPYERHVGLVTAAAYSPDGRWVASAGSERTVRVWQARGQQDGAVLHGHTGNAIAVAFAPDGRWLASLSHTSALDFQGWRPSGDNTVRVWEADPQATLPVLRGHTGSIYPVTFRPDGRWIASGGWDNTVRLWDAATGAPCAELHHPGVVHGLAYGPDGKWLVTAIMTDNRLRFWDVATARLRREIELPAGKLRSVTVRPDGRRLAASARVTDGHRLHVCDVESGRSLFSTTGSVRAYSPDWRWLAVVNADEKILVLLDGETHEIAAQFRGHEGSIRSAAFSPDVRRLATCSQDRTVRVWPIDGGACQVLRGHTDDVFAVTFHPDGTRLASAGRDRAVWLWDLARGEEVARLGGHTSFVFSLAFSPDGATLASGSEDNTVRLWDTAPLKVRYQARREAEARRPEADRLVEALWPQKNDAAEVVDALRADRAMGEPLRHAAQLAVLRRAMPPGSGK
jgi:WD40 repeat protein